MTNFIYSLMKGVIWVMADPQEAENLCGKTLSDGLIAKVLEWIKVNFCGLHQEKKFPYTPLTNKWNTIF